MEHNNPVCTSSKKCVDVRNQLRTIKNHFKKIEQVNIKIENLGKNRTDHRDNQFTHLPHLLAHKMKNISLCIVCQIWRNVSFFVN